MYFQTRLLRFFESCALLYLGIVPGILLSQGIAHAAGHVSICRVHSFTSSPWTTYMGSNHRDGHNTDDYNVKKFCSATPYALNSAVYGQIVTDSAGISYIGDNSGYLHAINLATREERWKTFLGRTTTVGCGRQTVGISSTPTIINGIIYVGGGNQYWYAVRKSDGHILWSFTPGTTVHPNRVTSSHGLAMKAIAITSNGDNGGYYNWSSPLIVGNAKSGYYAYIGVASYGDCPLVAGRLILMRLSDHKVMKVFNVVPTGQTGGGIWTSPSDDAIDPSTPLSKLHTIFITTGTATKSPSQQPYSESIVALDANTLKVKSHFRIPPNANDWDWGSSPTFYVDRFRHRHVAAVNKNGLLYVFDANNVVKPQFVMRIGIGGSDPLAGGAPIAGCTSLKGQLYCSGSIIKIGKTTYKGSIAKIDTRSGKDSVVYQKGFNDGFVIGSLSSTNTEIIVPAGSNILLLNPTTGNVERRYVGSSPIWAAPSNANGIIIVGTISGKIIILGQLSCQV